MTLYDDKNDFDHYRIKSQASQAIDTDDALLLRLEALMLRKVKVTDDKSKEVTFKPFMKGVHLVYRATPKELFDIYFDKGVWSRAVSGQNYAQLVKFWPDRVMPKAVEKWHADFENHRGIWTQIKKRPEFSHGYYFGVKTRLSVQELVKSLTESTAADPKDADPAPLSDKPEAARKLKKFEIEQTLSKTVEQDVEAPGFLDDAWQPTTVYSLLGPVFSVCVCTLLGCCGCGAFIGFKIGTNATLKDY